jgi:selenocysteine lyase/cysteine desulfurase
VPLDLAGARLLFDAPDLYLDSATYGLPPRPAWDAVQHALEEWRTGTGDWIEWQESVEQARATWARLVRVPVDRVAVGATVSELVGLVAASVPAPARVLAADVEFASLLFPWLLRHDVTTVPLDRLADAIDDETAVVAVSAVQSSNGEVADLDAIEAAAREHEALIVVDSTHGIGWLPLDASRFDAVACAGYKWLLSPRGTAYLALGERLLDGVVPLHAGWFAGEDPHTSYYGAPLRLAKSARRFDTSPAWFSWIGAAPALQILEQVGVETIHEHDLRLANRFREALGLAPADSAIVSAQIDGAEEKLARASIRAATRGGSLRAAFHVYNTDADVDAAVEALRG